MNYVLQAKIINTSPDGYLHLYSLILPLIFPLRFEDS